MLECWNAGIPVLGADGAGLASGAQWSVRATEAGQRAGKTGQRKVVIDNRSTQGLTCRGLVGYIFEHLARKFDTAKAAIRHDSGHDPV
jgi:hypothetical protein